MKTINNRIKSVVREEILIETTLNRIEEYVKNNEIAIITAWRNQFVNITNATDKPTHIKRGKVNGKRRRVNTGIEFEVGEPFSTTGKKWYNKKLQAALLALGYGVIKVRGRWHEELSDDSDTDDEESFLLSI